MKRNKGITLISLVITIILLIILAGISINLVVGDGGLIDRAKKTKPMVDISTAKEKLELIKAPVLTSKYELNLDNYLEKLEEVKEENNVDYIEKVNDTNAEVIVGGKYKFLITDEENGNVKIEYQGEAGGLELSSKSATYTYPNSGTFKVTKNESGGALSVKSENENIAKAEINGTTITVIPQNKAGIAKIVVTSAANGNYAEGKATYTATVENGTISLDATAYTGNYDGKEHDAITSITVNPKDAKVEYSLNGGEYSTTVPKVSGANTYTIAIRASKDGYDTKNITKTITIKDTIVPTVATITISGTTTQTSLPVTLYATVTHSDSESGIDITSCKYVINTLSTELGINSNEYTGGTFSSNGQKITIEPNLATDWYLHVLSVDKSGNAKETIAGPITISPNYHIHENSCYAICKQIMSVLGVKYNSNDGHSKSGHYDWQVECPVCHNFGYRWDPNSVNYSEICEAKILDCTKTIDNYIITGNITVQ